jgi:hypothetical protein
MAMAVEQRFAIQLGQDCIGTEPLFKKFAEQECLLAQGLSAGIVREKVDEFITEDGDAAGFEADDGDAGFNLRLQLVEYFEQQSLGAVEHAEVVERASTAEIGAGDQDAEAGRFQDLDGRTGGLRQKIIVERISPEEDLRG